MTLPLHKQIIDECATNHKKWRHFAISASAGTGKTYTIENLVLELLCLAPHLLPGARTQRLNLPEILVVTFTEKATGELKKRIREKIAAHIDELNDNNCQEPDLIQHLESNINAFDEASIFTIHGFCNKYLQSNSFESKSPLSQEIASAAEVSELVVRNFLRRTDLHPELVASIRYFFQYFGEDSLRVLYNTTCQFSSNDEIIFGGQPWDNPKPEHAEDNAELAGDSAELSPATYQAKFVELYRKLDPQINDWMLKCLQEKKLLMKRDAAIDKYASIFYTFISNYDPQNSNNAAENILANLFEIRKFSTDSFKFEKNNFNNADLTPLNELFTTAHQYHSTFSDQGFRKFFDEIRATYQEHLQQNGLITFYSMIRNLAVELKTPGSALLPVLREQFAFGIIDEFQDTSAHQWDIFRAIFYDENENAAERVLFLIGDPKQSIYRFQGADVNTCNYAMNLISNNDPNQIATLNTNYRSDALLIRDYNRIFSALWPGDNPKKYEPVLVGRKNPEVETVPALDFLLDENPQRTFVWDLHQMASASTDRKSQTQALNRAIVATIAHLVNNEKVAPQQIAILCERNKEFTPLLRLLRERGIAANLGGESGLFTSLEALHLVHLFQALLNPKDTSALMRCALGDFFGNTVDELHSIEARSFHLNQVQAKLANWLPLLENRQYEILFDCILQDTKIVEKQLQKNGGARAFTATQQLIAYALKLLRQENFGWRELCLRMQSLYAEEITENEAENTFYRATGQGAVQLLTMHKSKGLEFDVVFFATGFNGNSNKITTHKVYHNPDGDQNGMMKLAIKPFDAKVSENAKSQDVDEQKRLWYVGLTRAKYAQFIPHWNLSSRVYGRNAEFLNPVLETLKESSHPLPFITDTDIAQIKVVINESPSATGLDDNFPPYAPAISAENISAAHIPQRTRLQTSYSALARHTAHTATPLRSEGGRSFTDDEAPAPDTPLLNQSPDENRLILPPGAHTGTALHSIFEHIDYDLVQNSATPADLLSQTTVSELIANCLAAQHVVRDPANLEAAQKLCADIVWHTLHAQISNPTGGAAFNLLAVPASQRLNEMEYHLRLDGDSALATDAAMAGNLFGFMDLVFKHENHYFVLDWKSNFLNDYNPEPLQNAMETSQYTLQAAIYTRALQQFVQQFDPNAQVGGAIYLFLRGTQAHTSQGVWTAAAAELTPYWQQAQQHIHRLIRRADHE